METNHEEEAVFAQMFKDNDQTKPQFVCSTQPLASLLSRDSFLFFDGDSYGLYYPWRNQKTASKEVDPEYMRYLQHKGAFEVPMIQEQRHLIRLFLQNLFGLYPVVERDILSYLPKIPLLLLNALFLSAIRFDSDLDPKQIRHRLRKIFERCKLLETIEQNKVVLIQSYILLSTHEEGTDGFTSSKEYISKACNLCGELAITNMGGISNTNFVPFPDALSNEQCYSKNLLTRVLWTTFCCDRMISATSGREMIFNRSDMIVDAISLAHFEEGPEQATDFAIFSSWLSIANFIERIQAALYRPPNNRTVDTTLHQDITNWKAPELPIEANRILGFLNIAHCYASLLFLRCEVDSISFLLSNPEQDASGSSSENKVQEIKLLSQDALSLLNTTPHIVHNVLVVHVVLHIIALSQFEAKLHEDASGQTSELENYHSSITSQSIDRLTRLKDYWWFASTALVLCQTIFEVGIEE